MLCARLLLSRTACTSSNQALFFLLGGLMGSPRAILCTGLLPQAYMGWEHIRLQAGRALPGTAPVRDLLLHTLITSGSSWHYYLLLLSATSLWGKKRLLFFSLRAQTCVCGPQHRGAHGPHCWEDVSGAFPSTLCSALTTV